MQNKNKNKNKILQATLSFSPYKFRDKFYASSSLLPSIIAAYCTRNYKLVLHTASTQRSVDKLVTGEGGGEIVLLLTVKVSNCARSLINSHTFYQSITLLLDPNFYVLHTYLNKWSRDKTVRN